jgi:hypothetical protein
MSYVATFFTVCKRILEIGSKQGCFENLGVVSCRIQSELGNHGIHVSYVSLAVHMLLVF